MNTGTVTANAYLELIEDRRRSDQAMATRIGRLEAALIIAFDALDNGHIEAGKLAVARQILDEATTTEVAP